ncbi:glutathione S-transferase family protein [Bordetella avium]|uniref:Glutathione S-transferase n=3 Tax=Bordetella avium TaxID=521 RepID=Q2KWS3_BORA1|nr:glutathione S-transferase family protein [Bordetella avium]AZY51691.1 glutathione S-transferase family protein [Bordetella avium]RIQ16597.1 glutathione S-transferase family protein [Bordetella avium]RIQ31357.1 glutathione S-transferase family protein [Bordetella avium]RIQ48891.1 glutathione S-transferase family protein [Bordetella avium]RIQ67599.1 glutathione S-transferase family protein [Bordetella avium]
MRILGKASSINVRKVLWACDELNLRYTREDWGAGFRPTAEPDFLALNPNGQVPVVVDGDFVLWESNSILRYLANQYQGECLYPRSARERARVDQWLDWQATDLNSAWRYAFMALVRRAPGYQDTALIEASCQAWLGAMLVLQARLAETGAYVAGERFSLADIAIGLSVLRWRATEFERPALPGIDAYCDRLSRRAGFSAWAEPR